MHMAMSVKCMVFCGDELLLLQKKDPEGKLPWEFPGGGLEFGEDFAAAAFRETKEETGLDIAILGVAGMWSFARRKDQFLTGLIFFAKSSGKDVILSSEHANYAWVKPQDLGAYKLQESLLEALRNINDENEELRSLRSYFYAQFNKGI